MTPPSERHNTPRECEGARILLWTGAVDLVRSLRGEFDSDADEPPTK